MCGNMWNVTAAMNDDDLSPEENKVIGAQVREELARRGASRYLPPSLDLRSRLPAFTSLGVIRASFASPARACPKIVKTSTKASPNIATMISRRDLKFRARK